MNIPSINLGISTGMQGGSSSDTARKVSDLKKQREEYEKQLDKSPKDKLLENKIDSLTRRIDNLEARLEKAKKDEKTAEDTECETCENRRYQDGSDDPGVSFKSATKISPEAAASAVRGHEMEHVYRNRAKAEREGRKIVSQSVVIKSAICPECGKAYVSGGETRTVTKAKQENRFNVGLSDPNSQRGSLFDSVA